MIVGPARSRGSRPTRQPWQPVVDETAAGRHGSVERLFQNVAGRHEHEADARDVAIRVKVDAMADQVNADPVTICGLLNGAHGTRSHSGPRSTCHTTVR